MQPDRSDNIAKAKMCDLSIATFRHQANHIQARNSVTFRRFDAECISVKIHIEPASRAITTTDAVESQVLC